MDPPKLKRNPDSYEEISNAADEGGEDAERDGVEGGEQQGGVEEEGDLRGDEGEPDGEEGARLEVEGIEDVRDHET